MDSKINMAESAGSSDNRLTFNPNAFPATEDMETGKEYVLEVRVRPTAPGECRIIDIMEAESTQAEDQEPEETEAEGEEQENEGQDEGAITGTTAMEGNLKSQELGKGTSNPYPNPAVARMMAKRRK